MVRRFERRTDASGGGFRLLEDQLRGEPEHAIAHAAESTITARIAMQPPDVIRTVHFDARREVRHRNSCATTPRRRKLCI